jgi:hypothetical protein
MAASIEPRPRETNMSRALQTFAPVLKLLLVVVIIAAWVEANAKRIHADAVPPPQQSLSKSAPGNSGAGDCSLRIDRRNTQRIAPSGPRVIEA